MAEKLPASIVDAIQKRRSVRTFEGRKLSLADREKLTGYCRECPIPWDECAHPHRGQRSGWGRRKTGYLGCDQRGRYFPWDFGTQTGERSTGCRISIGNPDSVCGRHRAGPGRCAHFGKTWYFVLWKSQ